MNFLLKNKKKIIFTITSYFIVYFIYKFNFDLIASLNFNLSVLDCVILILFKILSISLISYRWSLISSFFKLHLDFFKSAKQIIFGQFFSIFFPSSIAIDYFKVQGLMKYNNGVNLSIAAGVDFFDRVVGVSSFIAINSFFVTFFFLDKSSEILKIITFFFILLLLFTLIHLIKTFLKSSSKIMKNRKKNFKIEFKKISLVFLIGLGSHFLDLISLLIVAMKIFDFSIIKQLSLISASQFSLLIAITPGSIGITESSFQLIYNFFQSNNELNAFNIPITIRIINYILLFFFTILIFLIIKIKYIKNYS
mgnify:CR=1 FL=1